MILQTSGWRHLKEKNQLFLSCEYQKMYHPRREMAQLPQVPQIENGKPDFSPTFQKVELHNSTFFQQRIKGESRFCARAAETANIDDDE